MKRGLTRSGVGQVGTLETFVRLAAEHRFQTVDASGSEIADWILTSGADEMREFLRMHGVGIGAITLPVDWRGSEEAFRSGLRQLAADAEAAAQAGCTACCTYVLPSTDWNAAHFMAVATRRLRVCAQILGAYGSRLGLEFVGPHHLRTQWKHPFIWTMANTLDWIDAIGEVNVGLLLDAFHWHTTSGTVADLRALTASRIVHVHISDAPDVPVEDVRDDGRLYPGEGVIDLPGFLQALRAIEYRGSAAQEVLTPQSPMDSPAVLLNRSMKAYDTVWAKAGLPYG
ncbi:MAG: sugar phosphate isomerase/epimerase family protein [Bacilli bacterium]